MKSRAISYQRTVRQVVIALASAVLLVWTVFPFLWILLTSLKSPGGHPRGAANLRLHADD